MATYDVLPEPHKVDAGRATAWLSEGWKLFMVAPGIWVLIGIAYAVIHVLLGMVPGIGSVAYMLLLPVLVAGLMEASRIARTGTAPTFETLFAGFRSRTGSLVMVGLLALGALAVIAVIAFVIVLLGGGASAISALKNITDSGVDAAAVTSSASIGLAIGSLFFAALVTLILMLPITMALWFAPALVFFDNFSPLAALKSSYIACLHNWLTLSIYGIVLVVLTIIAAIPFGLGLLVLLPVAAASVYISYCDIYHGSSE